jgi:hypothetical protein
MQCHLSKAGDSKVSAKVNLASGCTAPVIVLRERYEGKISGSCQPSSALSVLVAGTNVVAYVPKPA